MLVGKGLIVLTVALEHLGQTALLSLLGCKLDDEFACDSRVGAGDCAITSAGIPAFVLQGVMLRRAAPGSGEGPFLLTLFLASFPKR